jgi:glutathione S-transferase
MLKPNSSNRLQLYDLAGAQPQRRFSPYCWRTKLALAHKSLAFDTIPWRFTDKDAIAFSGQGRVPVLVDGDRIVFDSWTIATYLEDAYPARPSLFRGDGGRTATRFINTWADTVVSGGISRLIITDILGVLDEKDRSYFRETREKRFGATLEAVVADRQARVAGFRQSLEPLRAVLAMQPYLGGEAPLYADYIVFGCFQWARCASPFQLLLTDDPVWAWRNRLLCAFDGLAQKALGFPV